ncbi:retinol dehydrogenase 11 [Monomorium pharaonis]|uniref:retinol dehydrogenase 11 n=1 Tax=Monomorium pharaonis TaxID=307658 RepID=UPI00063FB391|nr:retinol dehydrogenase 11 [Monomorium pharaonis]
MWFFNKTWFFNEMCTSKARLDGKTVVITGASDGIGKETARDLYARGARVILACRNMEKTNKVVEDIKNNPPSRITEEEYKTNVGELAIYCLDLSSLKSVKDCAKNLLTNEAAIHILINNAGVAVPYFQKTKDGHETTLQVNYLGHFLLTLLLLPKMQLSSPNCRIVNVSSITYFTVDIDFDDINLERCYTEYKSYARTKLANILFTKELARRLKEANIHGINVYCLHPGFIQTKIYKNFGSSIGVNDSIFPWNICSFIFNLLFCKNVEQGAQTIIYCSVDEKTANETGFYYSNCNVGNTYRKANDHQYAKKLWNVSCRLLDLEPEDDFTQFLETVSRQML